jgi:hypothetical protein
MFVFLVRSCTYAVLALDCATDWRKIMTCNAKGSHSANARPHPKAPRPSLRLSRALPRIAVGATAALAAVSATFFVFGPFSDLSAQQLAAGPHSAARGADGKALVLATTGRSWGAEYERRAGAASAAASPRLARDAATVPTAQVAIAK